MRFTRRQGWHVRFFDRQDDRARFKELVFADRDKLEQLIERTATKMILEDRQAFETALLGGSGIVHLTLTAEQYRRIRR